MNVFFLAISIGFGMVMVPFGWYMINQMSSWTIEAQLMFIGFLIVLTSAVLFKLKKRFDET